MNNATRTEPPALAAMLNDYRDGKRDMPTYTELAALLDKHQPLPIFANPKQNEQLAREAQAIVDADVAALAFPVARESVHVTASELSCVINWLEGGCDPKDAAKELRLYRERASAPVVQQGGGELPQDETAAFEAWACPELGSNATDEKGFYSEPRVWTAWCAWKARGRLAQRVASVPATGHPKCHKCFGNGETHASFCPLKAASVPAQVLGTDCGPVRVLTDAEIVTVLHSLGIDTFASKYGFPEIQVSATNLPAIRKIIASCNAIAAPVPAASVQPAVMRALTDARNAAMANAANARIPECGDFASIAQNLDWALNNITATQQPDIGRDAARLNAFIDWYLRGGQRSEIHADGHMVRTTRAIVIEALDALATQAAPEVASVPDEGDDPFMYAIMAPDGSAYYEEHCVDPTPEALYSAVNALNDSPDTGYQVVPLYSRSQPAVQVPPLKRVYQVRHLQSPADWKTIPDAEKQRYLDDPEWDVQIAEVPDRAAPAVLKIDMEADAWLEKDTTTDSWLFKRSSGFERHLDEFESSFINAALKAAAAK